MERIIVRRQSCVQTKPLVRKGKGKKTEGGIHEEEEEEEEGNEGP